MDRRTVDEDLTLETDLEPDTDDADSSVPTGIMAPPKRTATRKPPVGKTASGRSGNASDNGKSNGRSANNGRTGSTGGEDNNSRAKPKVTVVNSAAKNSDAAEDSGAADNAAPADSAPDPGDEPTVVVSTADDLGEPTPADEAAKRPDDTTEVIPAKTNKPVESESESEPISDTAAVSDPGAAVSDEGATSDAVPAMPADDIWAPRSGRTGSGSAASWTPVEASALPRGNAFEMNDAFSAPPMPSESRESRTPVSSAFSSTPSTTPAQGFPRSASTAMPASTVKPAGTVKPPSTGTGTGKASPGKTANSGKTGLPRPPKMAVRRPTASRQAHLTVARVEPWSVMKFSFAVSLIAFLVLFVAVAVLYGVLSALGVFGSLQHLVTTMTSSQGSSGYNVRKWFSASRILGYTALLGGFNIVLITAMSTIGAVVYNLTSRLVGGVEVTLKETD